MFLPVDPDALYKNKYTSSIHGYHGDELYRSNAQSVVVSDLLTIRDLQRSEDYVNIHLKLSFPNQQETLGDQVKAYELRTLLRQPRRWTTLCSNQGTSLRRVQQMHPNDMTPVYRLATGNTHEHHAVDREHSFTDATDKQYSFTKLPELPSSQTRSYQRRQVAAQRRKSNCAKTLVQLPEIVYRMSLPSEDDLPDKAIDVKLTKRRRIITRQGCHDMARQPIFVNVSDGKRRMRQLRVRGRAFIAASGPPKEFGIDRAGWLREYYTPQSHMADHIYSEGFKLSMRYFKPDYLTMRLRGELIKEEKRAWFAWEKLNMQMFDLAVFQTFKLREIWNDDATEELSTSNSSEDEEFINSSLHEFGARAHDSPYNMLRDVNKKTATLSTIVNVMAERLKVLTEREYTSAFLNKDMKWFYLLESYAAHDVSNLIGALPDAAVNGDILQQDLDSSTTESSTTGES